MNTPRKLRTLLVDDEALSRRGLQLRLTLANDVEVIGECSNGREALEAIREHDLLHLAAVLLRLLLSGELLGRHVELGEVAFFTDEDRLLDDLLRDRRAALLDAARGNRSSVAKGTSPALVSRSPFAPMR